MSNLQINELEITTADVTEELNIEGACGYNRPVKPVRCGTPDPEPVRCGTPRPNPIVCNPVAPSFPIICGFGKGGFGKGGFGLVNPCVTSERT